MKENLIYKNNDELTLIKTRISLKTDFIKFAINVCCEVEQWFSIKRITGYL